MPYEALRTMTNMPSTYVSNRRGADPTGSWNLIKELAGKNYPMTSPCCNNKVSNGLVTGHAYTFLDAKTLSNGQKLV
jgi:hypothetical protein